MKKKIGQKKFDLNYFKKFEISNTNKILGGAGCQVDNCTYSADYNCPNAPGFNQSGLADDPGGTTDDTTTVRSSTTTTVAP